jgi:hypothetical protein
VVVHRDAKVKRSRDDELGMSVYMRGAMILSHGEAGASMFDTQKGKKGE